MAYGHEPRAPAQGLDAWPQAESLFRVLILKMEANLRLRFILPLLTALSLSFQAAAEPARLAVMSAFGPELEALKAAYERSTATMKERMEELTGGLNLNLPGMGG